jgi:PDZ domain
MIKKWMSAQSVLAYIFSLSILSFTESFVVNPISIAQCRLFPEKPTSSRLEASVETSFMWNRGLNFGKGNFKFYDGFEKWMSVFPEQDRQSNPDVFSFPKGVYEVKLTKPLGIVFEELESGRGLYVKGLLDNGNAEKNGKIQIGDVLIGITAVKVVGAKYERRLIPARKFDFDTMVGAIGSNEPRFACNDVILAFERPGDADSAFVDEFMSFFEPPFDNPWKQQQ